MKRFFIIMSMAGLIIGAPLLPPEGVKSSWAGPSQRFSLQLASCSTLKSAQKEIERLGQANIRARQMIQEDRSGKKWYIVYLDNFKTKEEAGRQGKQLIRQGLIKSFRVFPGKVKEEIQEKAGPSPPPSPAPAKKEPRESKEPKTSAEKSPVYFGPIVIREEENGLRVNILLDRKIFPEITADKTADGSRLIITFKNIDRYLVPLEFIKVQSQTLLSFNLANKGRDCAFVLLLSSADNYDVSQNYFEKEKMYSLFIRRESGVEPDKTIREQIKE
jgi:hypothetical protein